MLSAAAVEAVVIAGTAGTAAARRTCKNMAHVAYTSRTTHAQTNEEATGQAASK